MKAEIKQQEGKTILEMNGRLDTAAAPEVAKVIEPLLILKGASIVVDCSKLEYVSSSGLRLFITLRKSLVDTGSTLVMKALSTAVKDVFDMTGFTALFTIED